MAVAWWAGRDRVERTNFAAGLELARIPAAGMPRGAMLILGGDEVYPYASLERYENQMCGPYRLALPKGARSDLLALPGNHDWYDNLEAFRAVFCSGDAIGGWRTHQDASWFSARLPQGWWLWALDTGLEGNLNPSQREYFAEMAAKMVPGDQLVVCTPVPHWHLRERQADNANDDELACINGFLGEVVPNFVTTSLFLAGDSHVYAHYVQQIQDEACASGERIVHHVTSGGGGAFLHPTHNLAPKVPQSDNDPFAYQLEEHWPPRSVSRHTLGGSIRTLVVDRQSPALSVPFALLHGAFLLAATGIHARTRSLADIAGRWPMYIVGVLAIAAFWFAIPAPNVADPLVHRAGRRTGLQHGLVQLLVLVAVTAATTALFHGSGWDRRNVALAVAGSAMGGLLATGVFSTYLSSVNRRWRIHDNMAFSGRHIRGYKHFVRCRIDGETGDLTLFVVGIDTVHPGWASALAHAAVPPAGTLTLVDVIDIARGRPTPEGVVR